MQLKRPILRVTLCGAALVLCAARAGAEEAPPPPPAPAPSAQPPLPPPPEPPSKPGAPPVRPGEEDRAALILDSLPDVVVVAPTLSARPIFDTTATVVPISRRVIEREQPASLSDAIQYRPGLWSTQGSAGQQGTPVLRGLQGNQTLMMLDGARLTNDRTGPGPSGYWDLIDPDMIDHVEVLLSPDSVLYGTGAIGGVVAAYTAWPTDFAECGTLGGGRVRAAGALGGENYWRVRAEVYGATPNVRAVAGGIYMDANDLVGGGDAGTLEPTAFQYDEGDARVEWRIDGCNTLGLEFFAMRKWWTGDYTRPARDIRSHREEQVGILRWRNTARTWFYDDLEVRLCGVHWESHQDRDDKLNHNHTDVWSPQLEVVARRGLACGHNLLYGLHAHRDYDDVPLYTSAYAYDQVPQGWYQSLGVYAQDEWDVNSRWRLTAGVRFDTVRAKTDPDASMTFPLITPDDVRIDKTDSAWTGKLGALYRASPHVSMTGNLSRGYRFPNLGELAGLYVAPDEVQGSSLDVGPEYSTVAELGVHLRFPCFRASAVAYYGWYEDMIVRTDGSFHGLTYLDLNGNAVQDSGEQIRIPTNAGTANTQGIELAAEWDVRPHWTILGNFTYWQGDFSPDPTEPTGIPMNGTLALRWTPTECTWAQFSAHMVDRFDDIPADFYNSEQFFYKDPQDESKGPLRSSPYVPGYTLFDIGAGTRVAKGVTVTASVENLLDKQYRAFGSRHDGPGTTFIASVTFDF